MAMYETTVRFPKSIHARLREEAKREGVSAAAYVRDLVIVHFARMDMTMDRRSTDKRPADESAEPHVPDG